MCARSKLDAGRIARRFVFTRYRRTLDRRSRRHRRLQCRICDLALLRASFRYYVDRLILDEARKPRPQRFVAVVDAALEAWGARWLLYLGIAAACIGIQTAVAYIARFDDVTILIANCLIDGYATAFFTIAIAAQRQEVKASAGEIARAALRRTPAVTIVYFGVPLVTFAFLPWIFGSADEMLYGIGALPWLIIFGVIYVATVIACLDTSRPGYAQPGFAILRSLMFLRSWANIWRLGIGGAIIVIPIMLEWLLAQYLAHRGMPTLQNNFWSNIPIDALVLGPTQAFFTYLYMDLIARES